MDPGGHSLGLGGTLSNNPTPVQFADLKSKHALDKALGTYLLCIVAAEGTIKPE